MQIQFNKTVHINSNNHDCSDRSKFHCFSCGELLSQNEYNKCDDRCLECKRGYYDSLAKGLVSVQGYNKIDEILLRKKYNKQFMEVGVS